MNMITSKAFFLFTVCFYTTCLLSSDDESSQPERTQRAQGFDFTQTEETKSPSPARVSNEDHNDRLSVHRWGEFNRRIRLEQSAHLTQLQREHLESYLCFEERARMAELERFQAVHRDSARQLIRRRRAQPDTASQDSISEPLVRFILNETSQNLAERAQRQAEAIASRFPETVSGFPPVQPEPQAENTRGNRCSLGRRFIR